MFQLRGRAWRSLSFAVLVISVLCVVALRGQTAATTSVRKDPIPNFAFRVEIDGLDATFFKSVSGLASETEVVEFRDGDTGVIRKLPGSRKFPNLVLKRGFTGDRSLFNWYQSVNRQNPKKFHVTITLLNARLNEVAKYSFNEAWPSK